MGGEHRARRCDSPHAPWICEGQPPMTHPANLNHAVVAVILGGGRGTRLWPLTKYRAKPAVPLAGKYRLIDIPISNCLNSGMSQIYVLTQFNSDSLNLHITNSYHMDPFSRGFVALQAASQSDESSDWYQGTADAVRRNLRTIGQWQTPHVLILPGDTIFRMDLGRLLDFHLAHDADISVALHPTNRERGPSLGLVHLDRDDTIERWAEKPKGEALAPMQLGDEALERLGMGKERPFLGSMGIYIFKLAVLKEILRDAAMVDFGHNILPSAVGQRRVCGFVFHDFWEDIGTIQAFFEVNLALARPDAPFQFYYRDAPIYTRMRFLPSSLIGHASLSDTRLTEGCRIGDARLENCAIGLRSMIGRGVRMRRTVMMGADYYEYGAPRGGYVDLPAGAPTMGVGDDCEIENAIIDKNARIGAGVKILNEKKLTNHDDPAERFYIRDGIVIVPKHATLEPGTEV
jgi:glucose-1-phosphate adenylyltransferase